MRTTCNALCDFTVEAHDGALGKVKDIYFDDESWNVRYLVIDTRKWLPGRKVLLTPKAVERLDLHEQVLRLNLTRDQIRQAPSLADHLPVTRAHEIAIHDFYGWNHYWAYGGLFDMRLPISDTIGDDTSHHQMPDEARDMVTLRQEGEPHLASCKDLQGFDVQILASAQTGGKAKSLGELWDFVINTSEEWNVPFFVVEEDLVLGTRKIVLPTDLITAVDVDDQVVRAAAPARGLAQAPVIEEFNQLGGPPG